MCPVSMVTPVQAAGAGGREAAASPRQTEKAAGTRRSAELEWEPTCSRNGSRNRRRRELKVLRAQQARGAEPGAQDSWAARERGAARDAPGPDGRDASSRADGWRGLQAGDGHCPPTAALGGAGPGGGRPSRAPSPGAESPRPGGMGRAATAA